MNIKIYYLLLLNILIIISFILENIGQQSDEDQLNENIIEWNNKKEDINNEENDLSDDSKIKC